MKKLLTVLSALLLIICINISSAQASEVVEVDTSCIVTVNNQAFTFDALTFDETAKDLIQNLKQGEHIYYYIDGVTNGKHLELFTQETLTNPEIIEDVIYHYVEDDVMKTKEFSNLLILTDGEMLPEMLGIEILEHYTIKQEYSTYTRHFIVLKNNFKQTMNLEVSGMAFDKNDKLLGVENTKFTALGAGCTTVIYEAYDIEEHIDRYTIDITTSPSTYYDSVIQDLEIERTDISKGAVFKVTNNGDKSANFVMGYALFIKDGVLVDYETKYFVDLDYEIKTGKTIMEQFNTNEKFDTIKFFLKGRKYKD